MRNSVFIDFFITLDVRIQILLCGPDLELGSQSTCIVGLVIPTKGSSTSNHSIALLNPSEHPYSPLSFTHSRVSFICFLSLSFLLFSLQKCQPPSSHSILLFIAWDGWRYYDYFLISLVWMGSNLIISDKKMLCWERW